MATVSLYLDVRRVKTDGTCPLKLSVSHKSQVRYFALDICLAPSHWDAAASRVKNKHPQARKLNTYLAHLRLDADEVLLDLTTSQHKKNLTAADYLKAVVAKIKGLPADEGETFAARLEKFITSTGKKKSTQDLYRHTLSRMRAYDPNTDKLHFEDITREWLYGFDAFLAQTAPSKNYRNIHLRNIRAVFNSALDDEITTAYPFRRFKIKPVATPKRSLSVERMRELFAYPVEEYAEIYVDMFKLIFFLCGINVIDLCNLTRVFDGRVEYNRAKTGKLYSIKVEPEAMAIIDKYRGKKYLLDIMDRYEDHRNFTHRLNLALQRIGPMKRVGRGGRKIIEPAFPGLTSYWARHTWATIAADLDIQDATISLALGHAGENSTTEIYINRNKKKVDEANRRVIDWVLYGKK